MLIYTCELKNLALDWAVAKCEGWKYNDRKKVKEFQTQQITSAKHCYSKVWSQGGPIIEREGICISCVDTFAAWDARIYVPDEEPWQADGETPLIAAMRCYVASKLGDAVEIPEELSC